MLKEMADAGLATELTTNISSEQIRQQFNQSTTKYPMDNDSAPQRSAGGEVGGDISDEDTEETVYTDASLLDRHVRELLQSAGVRYDFWRAVENGTARKMVIDDDLLAAWERLEAAAPLLNKLAARHVERGGRGQESPLAKVLLKAGGSASGSPSGSASGSASGDDSGDTSTGGRRRTRNPDRYEHSSRGAASGSPSGSTSGDVSKVRNVSEVSDVALAHRFMRGERAAGIELLRRGMGRR